MPTTAFVLRVCASRRQSRRLNVENLLATAVPPVVLRRYEGASPRPCGRTDGRRPRHRHGDRGTAARAAVAERRRAAAVVAQQLAVDVGHDELLAERETLRCGQHRTVLGHQRMAGEDQIGRRLAETGRAVEVGRTRTRRLLYDQLPHVVALAHGFGRRREIENHLGAGRSRLRRRRGRHPQVLAYLHRAPRTADVEQQVGPERHPLPAQLDLDRRAP